MLKKIEIESLVKLGDVEPKDGGLVMELAINPEDDFAIKLSSYDDDGIHEKLQDLMGKKIKITIEVVK